MRTIYIKNLTNEDKNWGTGRMFTAFEEYLIPDEPRIANYLKNQFLAAITNGEAQVGDGITYFTTFENQFQCLVGYNQEVSILSDPPFQSKTLSDGSKLYRRKHGVSAVIPANSSNTLDFVVPYDKCKINKVEVVNGKVGDKVDLKVYDTPTGTLSTVPNYMLNQFGFDVFVAEGFYEDESRYDADLIKDMKIEITYYNNTNEDLTVYANFVLHQVV